MDLMKNWLTKQPIAHRGLHNATVPENSLEAFALAIEHGYAIELDVRLIDDGTVVVFHDDKLTRLTTSDGYVCNMKREELSTLKLLKSEQLIPTFQEVLELVNGQVPLLIELKNQGKVGTLEKTLIELLRNYKGDFAVQSFNPYSVAYFAENAPEIIRGQLSCYFSKSDLSFIKRFLLKRLKLNSVSKPHFIAYDIDALPNKYVTRTKLPVLGWTIRSNENLEKARTYCDNIIFENIDPNRE